jgi:HSP20 family molecular chaperone IbpA
MTHIDTINAATKVEETSPLLQAASPVPVDTNAIRSWSCSRMEEYSRKHRNLPDLISASNRLTSVRADKSYRAALRAAMKQMAAAPSRSATMPATATRSPLSESYDATRQPQPLRSSPSIRSVHSISPPLASGPAAGLQQQPGTYETIEQINNRYNQQAGNLPVYLIRTDLRYAPTLDMVTVYMELPGLRLEDVSLKIGNRSNGIRHLVVTAISRPPTHARDEMAMQERVFGIFSRTLIVPPHVQAGDIKAEMANGLLILQIPGSKFESITIQPRNQI